MISAEIRQILTEELERLRQRVIENMGRADQIVTGKTRDSMRVEVGDTAGGAFGVLTGRQAFSTLERGSRPWLQPPRRVPRFFADLIGEWIEAKGLSGQLNKWAVAHTIIHRGSKLYRTGGRADVYSPEISDTLERIGDRVIESYSVLVSDRLLINDPTIIHVQI